MKKEKAKARNLEVLLDAYADGRSIREGEIVESAQRRPNCYWQEWKNVRGALKRVAKEVGHFPSRRELKLRGLASVSYAVTEYHGGVLAVRSRMGYAAPKEKPEGYWKDIDNVLVYAQRLMNSTKDKKLPPHKVLRKKHASFTAAVTTYHGGWPSFRKRLGESLDVRERGTWKDINYGINEARRIMNEEGWEELPNNETLQEKGHSDLVNAVKRYYGGMRKFRVALGQKQKRGENGVWKDLEYAKKRALEAMEKEEWERLPGADVLHTSGYSDLANAISKYHRGYHEFRIELGEELKRRGFGAWKDLEYSLGEARKAMKEHGWEELPGADTLGEEGYSGLVRAIQKYHGGFHNFRKELGEKSKVRKQGVWKDENYVVGEALKAMRRHKWHELPTQKTLVDRGYGSMVAAIGSYHGGLVAFRERLKELTGAKSNAEALAEMLRDYLGGKNEK